MGPNQQQLLSSLRWFVATFGASVAGFAVGKGWVTAEQAQSVLSAMSNEAVITAGIGAAAAIASWFAGFIRHKEANEVAVVAAMASDPNSPVKGIVVTPTVAGDKLIADVGSSSVAPAGTGAANIIAN